MHIEIEKLLFGDFRVQVWDDNFVGQLDREYFCRGLLSAIMTADKVQSDMFPHLTILKREGDELTVVKTPIPKNEKPI